MTELDELNKAEDAYADRKTEICEQCHLPKLTVTYELGFRLIQEQLIDLKEELVRMAARIDTLDRRNVS